MFKISPFSARQTTRIREIDSALLCRGHFINEKEYKLNREEREIKNITCKADSKKLFNVKMRVTFAYPSFAGVPIDQSAKAKEDIADNLKMEISSDLTNIFLNEENASFKACTSNSGSDDFPYSLQRFENDKDGNFYYFIEDTAASQNSDDVLSFRVEKGFFLGSYLSLLSVDPRVYDGDVPRRPTNVIVHNKFWKRHEASFLPMSFYSARKLVLENVILDKSLTASQMLEQSNDNWKSFLKEKFIVDVSYNSNGLEFLVTLRMDDVCEKLLPKVYLLDN